MRIINSFGPNYFVSFLEDQKASGASPWVAIPATSTNWSFAIATHQDLDQSESIDIEVSNNEKAPDDKASGPVVITLTHAAQAAYLRASYRFCRAVKHGSKNPTTLYGSFAGTVNS